MLNDLLEIAALPALLLLTALGSYALALWSTYLKERTHNERLSRLVGAIGRVAGSVHDTLARLPANSNLTAVRGALLAEGVEAIKLRVGDTVDTLQVSDNVISGMIGGELGKLNAVAGVVAALPAKP